MLILEGKNKQWAIFIGLLIVFFLELFMVIPWQFNSIRDLSKTVREKNQDLQNLGSEYEAVESYKKQVADLDTKEKKLYEGIKNEDDILFLIENISTIAKEIGIKIMQIKPIRELDDTKELVSSGDTKYSQVLIEMNAKAKFHNLATFLSKIENDKIFYKVDTLEIESDERDISFHQVRLMFRCPIRTVRK